MINYFFNLAHLHLRNFFFFLILQFLTKVGAESLDQSYELALKFDIFLKHNLVGNSLAFDPI